MHPDEFAAMADAWQEKQAREDRRFASIQFVTAASAGLKISGRKPKLDDFTPDYAKPKRKTKSEADLKAALMAMARSNPQ